MMTKAPNPARLGASIHIGQKGFLTLLIAGLLISTTVPYVICYTSAPAHQRFTGVLFVRSDTDSYYTWMNQARHGHILFENKYQTQPHAGAYFNALWFVLGYLARLGQMPLDAALHIGRWIAGALLITAFYAVTGFWLRTPRLRAAALLLFMLGGGWGWASALILKAYHLPDVMHLDLEKSQQRILFNSSMDLWAGFHPFFQMFLAPHFAFAHALFLGSIYFFLRSESEESLGQAFGAGIVLLVLGLSRPYDALTAMVTFILYAGIKRVRRPSLGTGEIKRLLPAIGLPALALGYYVWLFKFHEHFKLWGKSARSIEPNGYVALALGLCGIIGLYQFGRWLVRQPKAGTRPTFLLCWLAAVTVLFCSYPVLKFSGQFGLVFMGPLVLLTAVGLQEYFEKNATKPQRAATHTEAPRWFYVGAAALILINGLSSPVLLYQRTVSAQEYYLDERIIASMQWLDEHTKPSEAVLASEDMGLKIPVYSQNYVFLGHPHLCDDYDLRSQQLTRFFDPEEDDQFRRRLLRENRIVYLFYSPFEKALGAFEPPSQAYLQKIYGNDVVEIYRVRHDLL